MFVPIIPTQTQPSRQVILAAWLKTYPMNENEYTIDIEEGRQPYNAYLVLPLDLLEQLTPLLYDEIMLGLAGTEGHDKVVLQLHLGKAKIEALKLKVQISQFEVAFDAR
jgi:hypothetical protein